MLNNPLFNIVLAVSIAAHAAFFAFAPSSFSRSGKITQAITVNLKPQQEAVKKAPEPKIAPTRPKPVPAPKPVKPPEAAPKREIQAAAQAPQTVPEKQHRDNRPEPEPAPMPPPNPVPENAMIPHDSAIETAGVDPSAPRGRSFYNTDTVVPLGSRGKAKARPTDDSTKNRGETEGTGRSQPEPPPPKKPELPEADRAALIRQFGAKVLAMIEQRKIYPERARRNGEQGKVRISLSIDTGGGLNSVGIASSSGSTSLDDSALKAARDAAPFPRPPAELGDGPLKFSLSITYRLQ